MRQMELIEATHGERVAMMARTRARAGAEGKRRVHDGRGRHSNSLAAREQAAPMITGRRAEVLAWLTVHGPATDREVLAGLYPGGDANMVRPRITELLDMGALRECGRRRCDVTGMSVRIVDAIEK